MVAPVLALGAAIWLWFKKRRSGLGYGLLTLILSAALFTWSIFQSRGSTAAIGLLFVPAYSSICAIFVWAFFQLKDKMILLRIVGYLFLFVSIGFIGYGGYHGLKERKRAEDREKSVLEIQNYRRQILDQSNKNSDNKEQWLHEQVKSNIENSSFLSAALYEPYLSADTLKLMAESGDTTILVTVISHKNVTPEIIESIFSKHKNDTRLDVAFAMNSSTSTSILEEVYKRSQYTGHWLSENLNSSTSMLEKMATENTAETLTKVLKHPKVNCGILKIALKTMENTNLYDPDKQKEVLKTDARFRLQSQCDN